MKAIQQPGGNTSIIFSITISLIVILLSNVSCEKKNDELIGNRFLTFNTVIRVNQIEVARNRNEGVDERYIHTPERIVRFREAIEEAFPGARITWAFSWLALQDTTYNYRKIKEIVAGYIRKYGDEMTFIPGGYFANAYNSTLQVNMDIHDALVKISEIVGNGYRPESIVAGFLSAKNLQYLSEEEGIHVCQGNIWSQFAIDNQDGDGSVSYPYYPSKEHFCKPAQGKDDLIDCVNLDGWTMDFLAARREGFNEGFNSRMGVGPIETVMTHGLEKGVREMIHTTAVHFDRGFELNGFAWVTNCWEISLMEQNDIKGLKEWLSGIKESWPGTKFITQGEFGEIWRSHYKSNDFDYRFEETGSGIGGSDADKRIRWFMNKHFRLALLSSLSNPDEERIIDFTGYDVMAEEPESGSTRNWSLMGDINQKQTRLQDKPVLLSSANPEIRSVITRRYPELFRDIKTIPPVVQNMDDRTVSISDRSGNLIIRLNYSHGCIIDMIKVNGELVTESKGPVYTGINSGDSFWSSMKCNSVPVVSLSTNTVTFDSVFYGPAEFPITEKWTFRTDDDKISWKIFRNYPADGVIDDNYFPCWQFSSMQIWDGAILDNGGVAWNRFLSEKGESYGTHSDALTLWNKSDNRCLKIIPSHEEGLSRVVTFRHQPDDRYAVVQSLSEDKIMTRYGLFRFLNDGRKVFAPTGVRKSSLTAEYVLQASYYDHEYDRGDLKGVNSNAVKEMFNTIGRYGVVDRNLYGSNGWRTGWAVLQEPWLALYGLANNFPEFINGFSEALEYYAREAIMPDGRVLPRWHHDSTDAMPGTWLENGFYECQWGYMLDTQPAFAINVAEQFDITGDTAWLRKLSPVCEKAIGYMTKRDADNDGLFEAVQQSYRGKKGTDWLDVIWASHEVSTINAYMYMALTKWSELEKLLGNDEMSVKYKSLALKLKTSYNKNIAEGGFWDPESKCYVHWHEKDGKTFGNNMNSVVNFLSIGYGLCDDTDRIKSVLDHTEELMQKENLFIWPACFFPYDKSLGLSVNYPFPNYENGDLFLAWAELGTRCYARYNPEIALKYIRNVITQYEKDGLSHQRYTRVKQTGAGDDILSNNIMAVVGLYRNLYGIRPQYNRLYLEPHLTPELNGTRLNYHLRGKDYTIALSENNFTINVENYSISENNPFAINLSRSGLKYFNGADDNPAFKLSAEGNCSVNILEWGPVNKIWQETSEGSHVKVKHELYNLEPAREYRIDIIGEKIKGIKADAEGIIRFVSSAGKKGILIRITSV